MNKLYEALCKVEGWSDFLIDLSKEDRDIILKGIDECEAVRIRDGIEDIEKFKTTFLRQMLSQVDDELERREMK